MAFANLEPFGELRADFRAGQIAATVANVNRGKGVDAYQPADFMPALKAERKRDEPILLSDPEEQAKLIKARIFRIK